MLLLGLVYAGALVFVWRARERPDDGQHRVTIRVAHWQLEEGMPEAFELIAHRYMALHPDVRVEPMAVPGNVYRQWLTTQLAGGTVPDLVSFNSTDVALVTQMPRHFAALDRWLSEPNPYNAGTKLEGVPWRRTFIDGGQNRATYFEQFRSYYAVGLSAHSMRIFYNRDLLRELTGADEPPRNFEEWLALGKRFHAARPDLIYLAGSRDHATWMIPTLVSQAMSGWLLESDRSLRFATTGLEFFGDGLEGRWDLHSAPVRTAFRIARAFGDEMPAGFLQLNRDAALQAFLRGEAFSIPDGTWDYPTMRAIAQFQIGGFRLPMPEADDPHYGGYALLPISDGGVSTALPLYLTQASRHKDVAVDFLRFVTSVEGNRLFSEATHAMPSIEGVPVPAELEPFRRMDDGYVVTSAQNAPVILNGPGAEGTRLWDTTVHVLYAPNGGVDAYLDAIAPRYWPAVRQDLAQQLSVSRENLRRRDSALAAQQFLNENERAEASRQLAGQHLVETQTYLMSATLERTAR